MADSLWIIGVAMTRFMRYKDKDLIDLGSEAALAALTDAGLTIFDARHPGRGLPVRHRRGGPADPEADRPDRHPGLQRGQRLRHRRHRVPGRPRWPSRPARPTSAWPWAWSRWASRACSAPGPAAGPRRCTSRPAGTAPSCPVEGVLGTSLMPGMFAQSGMEYAYQHDGVGFEQFAKVAEKNHAHSTLNPLAQYQKAFSLDEVMAAEMIAYPNTLLMCCPTGDGAAAAVLCGGERLRTMPAEIRRRAVKVSASVLTSDPYVDGGSVQPDVNTLTRQAADQAYEQAGVGPQDLDLVELHDCFATAELVHYDNLRLCADGRRGRVDRPARPVAGRRDPGQRVRRPALQGPPARRHRHRQPLRGGHPPARRGRRPPDRGGHGRPHPCHRPGSRLRRAHPGEVGRLSGLR